MDEINCYYKLVEIPVVKYCSLSQAVDCLAFSQLPTIDNVFAWASDPSGCLEGDEDYLPTYCRDVNFDRVVFCIRNYVRAYIMRKMGSCGPRAMHELTHGDVQALALKYLNEEETKTLYAAIDDIRQQEMKRTGMQVRLLEMLKNGEVKARGAKLRKLDYEENARIMKKEGLKLDDLPFEEIQPEVWSSEKIDWANSHALLMGNRYINIHVETAKIISYSDVNANKTKVDIVQVNGGNFMFNKSSDCHAPLKRGKRPYDQYAMLCGEILRRFLSRDIPIKRKNLIMQLRCFCKSANFTPPSNEIFNRLLAPCYEVWKDLGAGG